MKPNQSRFSKNIEKSHFITFQLKNTIPYDKWKKYKSLIQSEISQIKNKNSGKEELDKEYYNILKTNHLYIDEIIDTAEFGEAFLQEYKYASIVEESIRMKSKKDFFLIAYSIMPNHVHLLIKNIREPVYMILKSIKSLSERRINIVRENQEKIWQQESFESIIKTKKEQEDSIRYILNNPVRADLVKYWKRWPFNFCESNHLPSDMQ